MTLLEKLREKLGPELAGQVEDAVGDDFDWDFVPRARLNKVIGQRNTAQAKLQAYLDKQSSNAEDDDDGIPNAEGNSGNTEAHRHNEVNIDELNAQHQKDLANVAKRYAVLDLIRAKGALDPKLVLGQLDLDKMNLKEDDTLEGFDEQFNPWAESHSYMFQNSNSNSNDGIESGTGKDAAGDTSTNVDPFDAIIATIK
jgi:hypothetical protein